jgi:sugar phosphate isomerase/epimerase
MANYLLSAFADEYTSDFLGQLKILKELCINYLEIRGVDGTNVSQLNKEQVKDVKLKLGDFGIKISSIGSPVGKISIEGDLQVHYDMARRVFETANYLETKNIRMFSFYLPDGKSREECKAQVYDAMENLINIASQYGVTLCHENEANIYGESPVLCKELVTYFGGKLKCVFDMGNFVLDGYKPYLDGYQLLKDDIEYFHIKDSLSAGAIVPPGVGEAHIKEILTTHKKYKQGDIFVTLEPHLQTFDGLNALATKSFDNPYKYENQQVAFLDAYSKLKGLL